MGSFQYGTPEKRSWRKNAAIRPHSLESHILELANKLMRPGEQIQYVLVNEIKPENKVLLEFHCYGPGDIIKLAGNPHQEAYWRQNVFHILTEENPDWWCDSDLGRGYVDERLSRKRNKET